MALFGFGGTQRFFQTIRLLTLETEVRAAIDRPAMLAALLQAWQEAIGHPPDELHIDGPYGIAKGSTVGLKAFHAKFKGEGHAKYHGYSGSYQRNGFNVTFFRSPPYGTNFVEIACQKFRVVRRSPRAIRCGSRRADFSFRAVELESAKTGQDPTVRQWEGFFHGSSTRHSNRSKFPMKVSPSAFAL